MVIGVAVRIVEWIPPTQETEKIQKELIQPLCTEDSTMTEFVWSHSEKESSDSPVRKECDGEPKPILLWPEKINQI